MGNEFSSVEALWSTFENVMGKEEEEAEGVSGEEGPNTDGVESEGAEEHNQHGDVKMES